MPFDTIEDLPAPVKIALPSEGEQRAFLGAFNSCMDSDGEEQRCFRVGYAAATRSVEKGGIMASREYLEEALKLAKNKLPGWAWAKIHQAARGAAGGKIHHAEGAGRGDWDAGEVVRQIAMQRATKGDLGSVGDTSLKALWKSFGSWFGTYKRLNRSVDTLTKSSVRLIQEMEKRGIPFDESPLLKAARGLAAVKALSCDYGRSSAALAEYSRIVESGGLGSLRHNSPLIFVVSRPNEVEKARGEFLSGPDGRTFREVYLDPFSVHKGACSIVDTSQLGLLEWLGDGLVVALGKDARRALGSRADLALPHPNATRRFGDSGEVARKLRKAVKAPRFASLVEKAEDLQYCKEGDVGNFSYTSRTSSLNLVGYDAETYQPKLAAFGVVFKDTDLLDFMKRLSDDHLTDGTYEVGKVSDNSVEIVLDHKIGKGRYLLRRDVSGVADSTWTIESSVEHPTTAGPPDQSAPRPESDSLDLSVAESPKGVYETPMNELPGREVVILKADNEKQIVYGVVLDPHQVDAHSDWISPKAIEETAHRWMEKSRIIGFNHKAKADATAVESWLVPYPSDKDYRAAMANEDHTAYTIPLGKDVMRSGSWVLGTRLSDDEWSKVQSGEINAYSIGGFGARREVSEKEMPEVKFVDLTRG